MWVQQDKGNYLIDLGQHCLPVTCLGVSLQWVKRDILHILKGKTFHESTSLEKSLWMQFYQIHVLRKLMQNFKVCKLDLWSAAVISCELICILFVCLEFYGPANTCKVMLRQSVNLLSFSWANPLWG